MDDSRGTPKSRAGWLTGLIISAVVVIAVAAIIPAFAVQNFGDEFASEPTPPGQSDIAIAICSAVGVLALLSTHRCVAAFKAHPSLARGFRLFAYLTIAAGGVLCAASVALFTVPEATGYLAIVLSLILVCVFPVLAVGTALFAVVLAVLAWSAPRRQPALS